MSNDLNICQFIGRLGNPPETRYTQSGDAVASFSIACGSQWKDKTTGEKKEATEWISCTAFGKLAEVITQYLKKGSQVYISGKMKTEKYTDKNGVDRYSTKIVVDQMQMLGGKNNGEQQEGGEPAARPAPAAKQAAQTPGGAFDDFDSPF